MESLKQWSTAQCLEWANSPDSEGYKVSMRLYDWEDWADPKDFKYDGQESYSIRRLCQLQQDVKRGTVEYRRAKVLANGNIDEEAIEYF